MKKFFLVVLALIVAITIGRNYMKPSVHPIEVPENSFLYNLKKIDFGQSSQEIEKVLGKPFRTYTFNNPCGEKETLTYKRWTEPVTQSSVQLIFSARNQLSVIALHNGNAVLRLYAFMPQYNFRYTLGTTRFAITYPESSPYYYTFNYPDTYPDFRYEKYLRQFKYMPRAIAFLKKTELSQYYDSDQPSELCKSSSLLGDLVGQSVIEFELQFKPQPFVFPDDSLMAKLKYLSLGQPIDEVTKLLGKPYKRMPVNFDFVNNFRKNPYTYLRYRDEETGGHVQLLFDIDKKLTVIVVHKGVTNLNLKPLFPQYNAPFILGETTGDEKMKLPSTIGDFYFRFKRNIKSPYFGKHFIVDLQEESEDIIHVTAYIRYVLREWYDPWSNVPAYSEQEYIDSGEPKFSRIRTYAFTNDFKLFRNYDEPISGSMKPIKIAVLVSLPPQYFENWDSLLCDANAKNMKCRAFPFFFREKIELN